MLDIHLPYKGIRGFSEFLIHLFTITVGLLIAVQIESFVEWRHHLHLAEEAREALRAEIEHNLKDLKDAQLGLKVWREQIDADLAVMQRIQDNPNDAKAQQSTLSVNFSSMTWGDTAWRTAQSTGALAYMPYEEAEQYSNIYQTQSALMALEAKPLEDTSEILGLISRYNWHDADKKIVIRKKITTEQAGAVAEKLTHAQMHLLIGDLLLQECIENSQAYLENRKSRTNFTESLH
jgi:uncharacterized glyoxalase superfamily protein PhnB